MIVSVQWTLASPSDWVDIDLAAKGKGARAWLQLARKAEPTGGETLDDEPGWLFDVVVQGVHLYGFDHVAGEPLDSDGLRFYGWNDDVTDPEASPYRWGEVWEFYPPAPDPAHGGQLNTQQRKTVFTEDEAERFTGQATTLGPVEVKPWSQWVAPPENLVRHGIWVHDEVLWRRHFEVRGRRPWHQAGG